MNGADENAYKTVVVANAQHHHIDADKVITMTIFFNFFIRYIVKWCIILS